MLKGMGVSSIVKLVLAVMIASLFISITTVGSLGDALQESFNSIGQVTDFTSEIENKEQFSDLAMFVRDRAVSCEEVKDRHEGIRLDDDDSNGEGYPNLAHVNHLGQFPSCYGGEATVIRDSWDVLPGRGLLDGGPDENNMRGIYSREKFEITEEIIIEENTGNSWIEKNIAAASGRDYFTHISDEGADEAFSQINTDYEGSGRNFVFFFPPDIGEKRTNLLLDQDFAGGDEGFDDRVWYCGGDNWNCEDDSLKEVTNTVDMEVALCEGDEGYIQLNSQVPQDESGLGDAEGGSEDYYPRIVIEDYERESCGGIGDRTDLIPSQTDTSGRMLHIGSRTTNSHPYVRNLGTLGSHNEYSFDFHELNEDEDIWKRTGGQNIDFEYNEDYSEECLVGLYDSRSVNQGATGWVAIEEGTHIAYDGSFPDRDSVVVDSTTHRDSGPFRPRSTRDIYDRHVEAGFTGQPWEDNSLDDKILYNIGDTKYELYGDLLCAEDDRADTESLDDSYSTWYMCDGNTEHKVAGGETWSCDNDGRWNN